MSMAHCDPDGVEQAAARLRDGLGSIPRAVRDGEALLQDLIAGLQAEAESIRDELDSLDPDDSYDQEEIEILERRLRHVERRISVAQEVLVGVGEAVARADRLDERRSGLADHLDLVARYARDVARGGMPEPSPSRVSADAAGIDAALRDALAGTGITMHDLVPLPPSGAGAPGDLRKRIDPTDTSAGKDGRS